MSGNLCCNPDCGVAHHVWLLSTILVSNRLFIWPLASSILRSEMKTTGRPSIHASTHQPLNSCLHSSVLHLRQGDQSSTETQKAREPPGSRSRSSQAAPRHGKQPRSTHSTKAHKKHMHLSMWFFHSHPHARLATMPGITFRPAAGAKKASYPANVRSIRSYRRQRATLDSCNTPDHEIISFLVNRPPFLS
jgi:hypothetical protein